MNKDNRQGNSGHSSVPSHQLHSNHGDQNDSGMKFAHEVDTSESLIDIDGQEKQSLIESMHKSYGIPDRINPKRESSPPIQPTAEDYEQDPFRLLTKKKVVGFAENSIARHSDFNISASSGNYRLPPIQGSGTLPPIRDQRTSMSSLKPDDSIARLDHSMDHSSKASIKRKPKGRTAGKASAKIIPGQNRPDETRGTVEVNDGSILKSQDLELATEEDQHDEEIRESNQGLIFKSNNRSKSPDKSKRLDTSNSHNKSYLMFPGIQQSAEIELPEMAKPAEEPEIKIEDLKDSHLRIDPKPKSETKRIEQEFFNERQEAVTPLEKKEDEGGVLSHLSVEEQPVPETIKTKKNYIDPTAGFMYGIGCSLIHISMFIAIFFIEYPDLDKARELDEDFKATILKKDPEFDVEKNRLNYCEYWGLQFEKTLRYFLVSHVVCYAITFYRESFEAQMGFLGQIMRAVETLGLVIYFYALMEATRLYTTWYYLEEEVISLKETLSDKDSKLQHAALDMDIGMPKGFEDAAEFSNWRGRSLEWCSLELIVFMFFICTMLLLILKSRFVKVGIDHSHQFAPTYLSYLVNKIIRSINFDFYEKRRTREQTKEIYTTQTNIVIVDSINIKIKLNPDDYDKVWNRAYLKEYDKLVDVDEAAGWLERNLLGEITVDDLNEQRRSEINQLDLMQNSNIIYHSESVLEMQIFCLITSWIAQGFMTEPIKEESSNNEFLMWMLLLEHVCSYAFHLFRLHDIKKNGRVDVNGVQRAPRESYLQEAEVFFDCILIGYAIKHMIEMDRDDFHNQAFKTYWIIIDCSLLFLTLGYNYICNFLKTRSEITKNVYSLHFVQRRKIREKRAAIISSIVEIEDQEEIIKGHLDGVVVDHFKHHKIVKQATLMQEFTTFRAVGLMSVVEAGEEACPSLRGVPSKAVQYDTEQRRLQNEIERLAKEANDSPLGKLGNMPNAIGDQGVEQEQDDQTGQKQDFFSPRDSEEFGKSGKKAEKPDDHGRDTKRSSSMGKGMKLQARLYHDDQSDSDISSSSVDSELEFEEKILNIHEAALKMNNPSLFSSFRATDGLRQQTLRKKRHSDIREKHKRIQMNQEALEIKEDEVDYLQGESVSLSMDVYNLTIAANMTRTCSPVQLVFCLKQCFLVFILQVLLAYFFMYDDIKFENFQPFNTSQTALRLICTMLLQITLYPELSGSIKLLTFLKRQKMKGAHLKTRFINILICMMQITTPIAYFTALVVSAGQEPKFTLIIKSYVILGFLGTVDNIFVTSLPNEIKANAVKLNESGLLKMGPDHNSFKKVFQRLRRRKTKPQEYLVALANWTINLWWFVVSNLQIILFNYFAPYIVILFQYLGYVDRITQ